MEKSKNAYYNAIASENLRISLGKDKNMLNTAVFGATGSGKTRQIVKPNILQMNASFIVTDPMREISYSTAETLYRNGYDVRILDITPGGLSEKRGNCYNPLAHCGTKESVIKIAQILVQNDLKDHKTYSPDPFWEDTWEEASVNRLAACIALLVQKPDGDDRTYAQIPEIMGEFLYAPCIPALTELFRKNDLEKTFQNLEDYAKKKNLEEPWPLRMWKLLGGSSKTLDAITLNLRILLEPFAIDKIKDLISYDDMPIETLGTKKTAIFLHTPLSFNKTLSTIKDIFYTQVLEVLETANEGGWDLKLKNGEVVQHFSKDPDEDTVRAGAKALKDAVIVYHSPSGIYEGADYVGGKYNGVNVKIDNGWYEIEDKDHNVITRRQSRALAEKFVRDLRDAELVEHKYGCPVPVRFLLDEFPNLNQVQNFEDRILCMSRDNVSVMLVFQSITQLKGMYPDNYKSILNRCPVKIYMGGDELATCEYFSSQMGSFSEVKQDKNSQCCENKQPLMTPEAIWHMEYKKQIVLLPNEKPLIDDKFHYTEHKNYKLCRDFAEDCGLRGTMALTYKRSSYLCPVSSSKVAELEQLVKEERNKEA